MSTTPKLKIARGDTTQRTCYCGGAQLVLLVCVSSQTFFYVYVSHLYSYSGMMGNIFMHIHINILNTYIGTYIFTHRYIHKHTYIHVHTCTYSIANRDIFTCTQTHTQE